MNEQQAGDAISSWSLLWILLAVLAAGGGCSEEKKAVPAPPVVQVLAAPDRQPVPGIKVVVMDPETNLPVAGPVVSDQEGCCVFPGLPAGSFRIVVFGGAAYRVVDVPPAWNILAGSGGDDQAGLLAPENSDPPVAPVLVLVAQRQASGGLPRITGQVVDADTGSPLAGAFVSTSPFLGGYTGSTTVKDDVTLDDGAFSVSEIVFAQDPQSGNLVQIEPLLVARAGYRPLSWKYSPANGDDNTDISGVIIPLERATAQDTGILGGRLLLTGKPAVGVIVGLGSLGAQKSGVGQPGYSAVTDAAGRFRFTGLPAGRYLVHPGFGPHDGFRYPDQPGNVPRTVVPGQETDCGDLAVLHEVELAYPPNGWEYFGPQWVPPLAWTAVPGARRYAVYLDQGLLARVDTTSVPVPGDWEPAPGLHSWFVEALDDQDSTVGATEVGGYFFIVEPAAD